MKRIEKSTTKTGSSSSAEDFIREFSEITGLTPSFDPEYLSALRRFVDYLRTKKIDPIEERRDRFLAHVNWKFRLNAQSLARFYAAAAQIGFTFHYHHKRAIQRAFDLRDASLLEKVLREREVPKNTAEILRGKFLPVGPSTTVAHLLSECVAPSKLRREKGDRDIKAEILKAQFSAFMWCTLPERELHAFFDPFYAKSEYRKSFWDQLHARTPHLFGRSHALHVLRLDEHSIGALRTFSDVRNFVCGHLRHAFEKVNNYGFLAVLVSPHELDGRSILWEIAADITLYAEKHRESRLDKAYFRWERVQSETTHYISGVNPVSAQFDRVNEGFTYRDCYVITGDNTRTIRLLLIFQKNERDETPVPCPTCRSADVQGNSYPSLGVRSWECNNLLCPDRSKYNRGKRYSFRGLAMQQAIDDERNEIPVESVRRWVRDVIHGISDFDILEMLLRHYSLFGDSVHLVNWPLQKKSLLGRNLVYHRSKWEGRDEAVENFWHGPFFARYVCGATSSSHGLELRNLGASDFQVFQGDSSEILRVLPEGLFDAAVTSPPYYNAREYSQWPNVYCYLWDMFRVNREVFRTLKPGAPYFYNIFDYFDNERTVVFSAMGEKRMILSAYTVDLFRRIGFECVGNVVWDKGDIEGKRGFNSGNFSPYYQAPFNCWEHVFIFRKPGDPDIGVGRDVSVNYVLREQPVVKMVRGENVHGHTAPFPDAIPELAIRAVPKGGWVLDPFAGSLTTGRVASRHGVRSVCIERSKEYCLLGLRMKTEEDAQKQRAEQQLTLFDLSG